MLSVTATKLWQEMESDILGELCELQAELSACIADEKATLNTLLDSTATRFVITGFWNVAFSCMHRILVAHRDLSKNPD